MANPTQCPDSGRLDQDFYEGGSEPAFLVDIARSQLVAANASGLFHLGLPSTVRLPLPMDSAMPALCRLRQSMAGRGFTGGRDHLTFWIDGRLVTLACTVHAATGGDPTVALIVVAGAAQDERGLSVAPSRDDAQTLKDIARAIREGGLARSRTVAELPKPLPDTADHRATAGTTTYPPATDGMLTPPVRNAPATLDGAYLARLAHEIKTPLSAIVAAAEIMRDERLGAMGNAKYLGYAADIHESASHALAVIGKMLGADVNTSHDAVRLESVDLNCLAKRVVSGMLPLARARGLSLVLEGEPELAGVHADPTSLRQILLNLLTNALKFTAAGGGVYVVTGYLDNGSVFLVVRDTGEGMDEKTLAEVFNGDGLNEFTARAGGGLGIGLPLVRRLAEANGAALEIDSAPGKGTVVVIAFAAERVAHR